MTRVFLKDLKIYLHTKACTSRVFIIAFFIMFDEQIVGCLYNETLIIKMGEVQMCVQ